MTRISFPGYILSRIFLSLVLIILFLPAYQSPAKGIGPTLPECSTASVSDMIPGISLEAADGYANLIFIFRDIDNLDIRYINPGLPDDYPAPFQRKKKPKGIIPKNTTNKETLPFQIVFTHQETSFRYFISKEKLLSCKFERDSNRIRPPPRLRKKDNLPYYPVRQALCKTMEPTQLQISVTGCMMKS